MDNIIPLYDEDAAIQIENSEEFIEMSRTVGAFIKELPLTTQQNDELIARVVEHLNLGRADAFRQGFIVGVKVGSTSTDGEEED